MTGSAAAAGTTSWFDDETDGAARAAGPAADRFDGGPGRDIISYQSRTRPVFVDLAHPCGVGEPGEGDRLRNLEAVVGGRGNDRLVGDERRNILDGDRGRDRLIGRGGADELRRGEGQVGCGDQSDSVAWQPGFRALAAADCEFLVLQQVLIPSPPLFWLKSYRSVTANPVAASRTRVSFRVWCAPRDGLEGVVAGRCGGGLLSLRETRGARRMIAVGHPPFGAWFGERVTARLTALGRRLATRPGGVQARVRLRYFTRATTGFAWMAPPDHVLDWTTRLKVPG